MNYLIESWPSLCGFAVAHLMAPLRLNPFAIAWLLACGLVFGAAVNIWSGEPSACVILDTSFFMMGAVLAVAVRQSAKKQPGRS